MIRLAKHLFAFVLIFMFCANIHFIIFPELIRTKLIIGVLGVAYFIFSSVNSSTYNKIKPIFYALTPLLFWMLLSILINQSTDWWFLRFSIIQIIYIFGAWMITRACGVDSVEEVARYLMFYVVLQNSIAFLGLQFPEIRNIVESTSFESSYETQIHQLAYRGMGFGDHVFFGGGVWTCIGLLMITYLYKLKEITTISFVALYVYVFFTGLFVARTAIAGLITIIMLFIPLKKYWYKMVWVASGGLLFFSILGLIQSWMLQKGYSIGNAFEIYNTFMSTGELTTSSSEGTIKMWSIIPNDLKTWIIGDALYNDPQGGYYMHTDVGYLRVIWYGGIIGLILYLKQIHRFCYLVKKANGNNFYMSKMLMFYFILVLILLWKGHSDTSCVLYLMFCASVRSDNKKILKFKQPLNHD